MSHERFDLMTVQMNQPAALFAFTVNTFPFMRVTFFIHILKTGGTVHVYNIFIDDSFIHQAFKLTIYGGFTDFYPQLTEMLAHISGSDMTSGYRL